ncbi:MAG: M20 family metallo-hydrolase [Ilumatobacteraceae bacterium]
MRRRALRRWGNARLALTDADGEGRRLVMSWMADLGLDVTVDGIGNVVATYAGTDPSLAPVMMGSHIDTVGTGGRFDGCLGVLAGLEVVETMATMGVRLPPPCASRSSPTKKVRFPPDMLGSLVYVGGLSLEAALDARSSDGARLGDELSRIGFAGPTPCPAADPPYAFLELHIEQGPVLEDEGITIGAVTRVQGISWSEFTIEGRSAHAGTTPIRLRRDPTIAMARVIEAARELALEFGDEQVCTVGRIDVVPNLVNVVPQRVTFTLDVRNTDEQVLRAAEARLFEVVDRAARSEGCTIVRTTLARFEPVEFDPTMIDLVESTARELGYSCRRMPSGAGHDAQMLARVCPTSMIFVPSVDGLSHNLAEFTTTEDLAAGANVLLHAVRSLARS